MKTLKTTACVLSLATAGFAAEDEQGSAHGSAPATPAHQHHVNIVTPDHVNIVTPVQEQLNALTPPQNAEDALQPQIQFSTPQDQVIQNVMPGAPARVRFNITTPSMPDIDRLVLGNTSSPVLITNRKALLETICGPKGDVLFTTAQKKAKGSGSFGRHESPTGVTGITRLEADMFTPAVRQFTTRKNLELMTDVDPVLEDQGAEEESVHISVAAGVNSVENNSAVHDMSVGSFVIHGAAGFGNSSADDSVANDSSFVIHGRLVLEMIALMLMRVH